MCPRPTCGQESRLRRRVRLLAFKPKDWLDWCETLTLQVIAVVLIFFALGRQRAMEELVITALYLAAALICFSLFVVLRVEDPGN